MAFATVMPNVLAISTTVDTAAAALKELGFTGPFFQCAFPRGEISGIRNTAGKNFTTDYVVIGHALNKPEAMTPMMNGEQQFVKWFTLDLP
jgi:hypothetical protein